MAYRCSIGNHGACKGCDELVGPADKDHCHIYRGGNYGIEVICGDCWISTAAAAVPVLNALKEIGLGDMSAMERLAFIRKHVAVGIDLGLPWE